MASSISRRNEELESYFSLVLFRKVCVSKAFIHPPVNNDVSFLYLIRLVLSVCYAITQSLGFVCFMVAVRMLSSAKAEFRMTRNEFFLSFAAGLGFGFFFIFIDKANDLAIFWPLVGARFASVSLLLFFISMIGKPTRPLRGQWILIGITGVLDAAGNALFSLAAHLGRLDVAAVLGSLYPAATVILAWFFLKERLRRQQWAGIAVAFLALILISV